MSFMFSLVLVHVVIFVLYCYATFATVIFFLCLEEAERRRTTKHQGFQRGGKGDVASSLVKL